MRNTRAIAVLGAGSWGTALALQLARNGHQVRLWGHRPETIESIARARENTRYLPGVAFPENLQTCAALSDLGADVKAVLVSVPSKGFRAALQLVAAELPQVTSVVWATKGLEPDTARFLHELVEEELPQVASAVLSGPSFALEVARGLPTAVTMGSADPEFAAQSAGWFHGDAFRVYTSEDVVGVQLGGALKNVLAIAAGISDGLGFGANARAALITRGLRETMRLSEKAGARRETLMGLSGIGDLLLTCTDDQSRNRRLGLGLGRGQSMDAAIEEIGQAVEGAGTSKVVSQLAARLDVEMPICEQVYRVLYEGMAPRQAVTELLAREQRAE